METFWRDYLPIIISVLSLMLALFSLGWNVYRDVILKPRVRVSVSHGFTMNQYQEPTDHLFISAVNHGPGKVRLSMIWFRQHSLWRRVTRQNKQGVLFHDWHNPLSGQLPTTLDVGEKIDLIFPWHKDSVLAQQPTHLGLRDSFDRFHWAASKDVRGVVKAWQASFGQDEA